MRRIGISCEYARVNPRGVLSRREAAKKARNPLIFPHPLFSRNSRVAAAELANVEYTYEAVRCLSVLEPTSLFELDKAGIYVRLYNVRAFSYR